MTQAPKDNESSDDTYQHPDVRRVPWWAVLLAVLVNLLSACVSFEDDGKAHVRYANCEARGNVVHEASVTCKWQHKGLGS